MNKASVRQVIDEVSQVSAARRAVGALATSLNFTESEKSNLAIVVTELGTNLVKHGGGGAIIYRTISNQEKFGIELLALDNGPGDPNIERCLKDGFSTTGSRGTGLGAIQRLSHEFDIFSRLNEGTAVLSRSWSNKGTPSTLETGAVCIPYPGELLAGDDWEIIPQASRILVMIADGLGHGPDAHLASSEAVRVFREEQNSSIQTILNSIHLALARTRGAAIAIASIDVERHQLAYAGFGNIAAAIVAPGLRRNLVSMNGTVGQRTLVCREFTYPWQKDDKLVMHSDGLQSRWDLDKYYGIFQRSPGLIAGVLSRDFERKNDDLTVVVVKP
jgi:anti-sigma regulatory factor (Ser/Thr protein kinase)